MLAGRGDTAMKAIIAAAVILAVATTAYAEDGFAQVWRDPELKGKTGVIVWRGRDGYERGRPLLLLEERGHAILRSGK
jgi:hypothetical protein